MEEALDLMYADEKAYYLDVSKDGVEKDYQLVGYGITSNGKTMNPQSETKQYVNQKTATTIVNSYQVEYPFEGEIIKNDKVIKFLYDIVENETLGAGLQRSLVTFDFPERESPDLTSVKAKERIVSIEISEMTREAGNTIKISGSFKAVADLVDGTFNATTREFTKGS